MARKIKSLEEAPIDLLNAVRRGFIHRGLITRKLHRGSQPEKKHDSSDKPVVNGYASDNSGNTTSNDSYGSNPRRSKDGPAANNAPREDQDPGEVHDRLIDITEKAHDVLFKADTVWPFTMFPDTITLDREKLSVANRSFFRVAKIITVPITSLISAEADVGPLFGSLKMTSKYFINTEHSIHFLWRNDATEIHRLLQGFIIAQEKGLDVTDIELNDLKVLLHDLGQGVSS